MPLPVSAAPPERHGLVELLPPSRGALAQGREVRYHAEVEEYEGAREVRAYGEDVIHDRRLEARPELPLVRIRERPVQVPGPAHVDEDEERHDYQGQQGHRLRAPRYGPS